MFPWGLMQPCFLILILPVSLFQHGVEPAVSLLLLQKMQKDLLQLQGSDSHANYMISARSEVLNNQVKPEETMMVSSLVWSAVKAKEQPRGVFHVQLLPLLMAAGLQGVPASCVSCAFVPRVWTPGRWQMSTSNPQAISCTRLSVRELWTSALALTLPSRYWCPGIHGREGLLFRAFHLSCCFSGLFG